MRIIPVLDLKDGHVVRGVGGRRQEYRPILSRLTASSQPVEVARAYRDHYGLTELYVADLDAIVGAPPAVGTYGSLRTLGFRLWVDAGIREAVMADWLAVAGIERIVLGLETVAGPHVVAEVGSRWGLERVVFSLDLQSGRPLGNLAAWNQPDAKVIAAQAIALGVRHLLVLDLARVGTSEGTGTEELCTWLAATYPPVEVIAGGGVRDVSDLRRLQKCGVRAVLVASALHDGRLTPEDLVPLAQSQCE